MTRPYLEKIIEFEPALKAYWRMPTPAVMRYLVRTTLPLGLARKIAGAAMDPGSLSDYGILLNLGAEMADQSGQLGVRARLLPTTRRGWETEYAFYQAAGRARLDYDIPRGAIALAHPFREPGLRFSPLGQPDYYGLQIPWGELPRKAEDVHAAMLLFELFGDLYSRRQELMEDSLMYVEKSVSAA